MSSPPPVLSLSSVTVEFDPTYDSGIWNVSLRLNAGEMALVRLERGHPRVPVTDAAEGLVEPTEGTVSFLGKDWRSVSPDESAALRGRIGRVFDGQAWVSNLDVDENVVLAQHHHTRRPAAEVADEAAKLARQFGLPGLPRGRPAFTRAPDLQRAALVRALMGKPDLVILERPTQGVYPELLPPLINAVRAARARGAAVLWTTLEQNVWSNPALRPTYKCVMTGSQMMVTAADAAGADPGAARDPAAAAEGKKGT